MSKTVEKILCGLRDFGSSKLAELDSLCSINQEWLSSAVEDVKRQIELLRAVQLPVDVPETLQNRPDDILNCMLLDKKTVSGDLKFILPDRIGHVEAIGGIDSQSVVACLS